MGNFFLSAYDYSIEYKNTKAHANADSLSRLPIEGDEEDTVDSLFKVSLVDGLPITATDIATETVKDSVLSHVYQYVLQGWPQKGVSDGLKPFISEETNYLLIKDVCYGELGLSYQTH